MIPFIFVYVTSKQSYLHSIYLHFFPFLYFKAFKKGYLILFFSFLFYSFPLLKYILFYFIFIYYHSIQFHSLINFQTKPKRKEKVANNFLALVFSNLSPHIVTIKLYLKNIIIISVWVKE